MAELNQQQVVDYIKGISVLELSQLVKALETELGVSAAAAMPMGMMPMAGGAGSGMANPYSPNAGYNPYINPYFTPNLGGGGVLYGEAALLNSYATVVTSQEQARILREQALQAKIDTARKRFDFDLYVRACDKKSAHGCLLLGEAHDLGKGTRRDPVASLVAYGQGCDARPASGK